MNKKTKGTNAERELIKLFWESDWAAIRSAGSGSQRQPAPDILAGNKIRRLAIECKSSKDLKKYLTKGDVEQLKFFANVFGAEPWFGIRFDVLKWYFLTIEDLRETTSGFVISIEDAKNKGLLFEELIK